MNIQSHTAKAHDLLHRSVNSICNRSDLGLIKISGVDAKKILQGQLTCHMEEVTPSKSQMGAHCNPQGRVLSLFYVFQRHASYYLLMPRQLIPIASAALKKYAIFYKTEVTDASDDFVVIGYICKELKKEDHFTVIQTGTHPLIQRYLLVGDKGSMNETWNHFVHSLNIISLLNWKQLDIYEGIPALYPATSGKFLPHDINLEKLGAIHFDKGCYTGQEIIARMHYRGKLKNHLYHTSIESTSTLLPGADFYLQSDQPENASAVIVDSCREESREKNYYNVLIVTDVASATLNHLNKV